MMNIADLILLSVLFIALFIGSITDIKKREVPDWISFSLIAAGLGIRLCYSLLTYDWSYIVNGLAGFILFLGLAYAMFYAGQWGGGDSKVMMGVGAILGLNVYSLKIIEVITSPMISFFINALFVGAVFGLLFSIYLAIRSWKNFKKEFLKLALHPKSRKVALALTILLMILLAGFLLYPDYLIKVTFGLLIFFTLPALYLIFFVKAVEKACMIKKVLPDKLTEGDWIVKDIKINGKRICGPKDLGIEKAQIAVLMKYYRQGRIKKVMIKEGVPFVPSFFIALIVTLAYGNWFLGLFI